MYKQLKAFVLGTAKIVLLSSPFYHLCPTILSSLLDNQKHPCNLVSPSYVPSINLKIPQRILAR